MSIKIYDGFRLPSMDLGTLLTHIREFRQELIHLIEDRITDFLARRAIDELDKAVIFEKSLEPSPFLSVLFRCWEDQKRILSDGLRNPEIDFGCSFTFFPVEKGFLGICFTEQRDFLNRWFSRPFVESYPYWNNTDPPDDVSLEEWGLRSDCWESALGESKVPDREGFSITVIPVDVGFAPSVDDVLARLPDLERRSRKVAAELILREKLAGVPESNLCREAVRVSSWLEKDGREILAERATLVASCLINPVTKNDLLSPVNISLTSSV